MTFVCECHCSHKASRLRRLPVCPGIYRTSIRCPFWLPEGTIQTFVYYNLLYQYLDFFFGGVWFICRNLWLIAPLTMHILKSLHDGHLSNGGLLIYFQLVQVVEWKEGQRIERRFCSEFDVKHNTIFFFLFFFITNISFLFFDKWNVSWWNLHCSL